MSYQLPTPDDYSGATDILKILAALNDPSAPLIYFQRMYTKVAGDPVLPIVSGKTLMGPGKFGGCGITSKVPGHLFETNDNLDGFTVRGLQLLGGEYGVTTGNAIKVTPAAATSTEEAKTARWILLDDCLIRLWKYGSIYMNGTTMYSRINNCRFACDNDAHPDSSCVYIDRGTLACVINETAIGGPRSLLRSYCDGIDIIASDFEPVNCDAIYIDAGTASIHGGWFDPTYLGSSWAINAMAGATVNVSGSPRGLNAAKIHGPVVCTP